MKRTTYTFAGETFTTQREAKDRIKLILYAYPLKATLGDHDTRFMCDVLALHPEAGNKVGCGVASIQVEDNGGTRGFWITRIDGTRTDFSYLSCLSAPSHASQVLRAMRAEIRGQIDRFRSRFPPFPVCPVTGEDITASNAHVDHAAPNTFDLLSAKFLETYGIRIVDVCVLPTRDGETSTRLAVPVLAAAWNAYHYEHARLRMVSKRANLSVLRRGSRR